MNSRVFAMLLGFAIVGISSHEAKAGGGSPYTVLRACQANENKLDQPNLCLEAEVSAGEPSLFRVCQEYGEPIPFHYNWTLKVQSTNGFDTVGRQGQPGAACSEWIRLDLPQAAEISVSAEVVRHLSSGDDPEKSWYQTGTLRLKTYYEPRG
jgi:hypothetical protein